MRQAGKKTILENPEMTILGFNKNIFFTGLTSFFTDTSSKMVYSVMPMFLMSLGASKTTLSVIEGIAESTAALVKALSGLRSDKTGKNKPLMFIGYAFTAIVTPFYALVVSPMQVLYLRFIERFGKGMRTAPRDSLIACSAKGGSMGKSFGFHKTMDNAGAIAGPLLAFMLLKFYPANFPLIFVRKPLHEVQFPGFFEKVLLNSCNHFYFYSWKFY
jgi:sugar phosphate permease